MLKKAAAYAFLAFVASLSALPAFAEEAKPADEAKPAEEPKISWKLHAEASFAKASGNTDTETFSGKLELKREGPVNRYYLNGAFLFSSSEGDETANRFLIAGRWERVLTERMFGFVSADYIRDKLSGYEYRVNAGPGLGYDFLKGPRHTLKGLASVLCSYDKPSVGGRDAELYASARAAVKYEWQVVENLKFKQDADFLVSLANANKYFASSLSAVEVKINANLSLGVSYAVNYQNLLPSPDKKHVDTLLLTSLILDI